MAFALVMIATGAGKREVTRVAGIITNARAEILCCTFAEPCLWYHMFQRAVAHGRAVVVYLQACTTMQASRVPDIIPQDCFRIGLDCQQKFSTKADAHFLPVLCLLKVSVPGY